MSTSVPEIITDPVFETSCLKCNHLLDVSGLPTFTQIACPECGMQQNVPGKMGPFFLVDLLGKGGMGAVYRARDTGLDRWVAVKVMQSTFGGNPEFVETFRREAQAAAALNHLNIVQIYSFGVSHGQPYMAMELLEGGRLDLMISKGEMLSEALVLKIAADVVEGLNAAAAINLIHGDVKPENILLDANGVAKVVDFGLARFKQKAEAGTAKGIWGTPYYIAPEKLRGHPADARSDIYSLGGTLFHALTLKPPFEGETPMDVVKARLHNPAPLLRTLRPGINSEVEAIVGRMLEADPLKRYPNYASLLADIRRVLSTLKPGPASSAQPSIKSGKIVFTRKKGGGPSGLPSSGSSGSIAQTSAASEGMARPKKSRTGKIVLWVFLGLCVVLLLIGGLVGYQQSETQKSEVEKEKALVAKARKGVEQIWTNLQPISGDFSNRLVMAAMWSSNAQQMVSMISTGTALLADASDWVGARSNALAVAAAASQYMTGTLASASLELKGLLETVTTHRAEISVATNSVKATAELAAITNIPARVVDLHKSVADEMDKVRKGADAIDPMRQKLVKAIKAAMAAAELAAQEKAAQEKADADRRAAEKAEAEKQAKIQEEIKGFESSRKACSGMIQQHHFKQALEGVEQAARGLHTPEGKTAGRQAIKAYKLLVDLKTAIIDGVKADVKANPDRGFQFGWLESKDILGVDESKVTIRGGEYTWDAVPATQMMRFIKHYIDNGDLTRREQADHFFAVALYIHEAFEGNEKAKPQMARYLKDAIHGNSSLADLAKAILPDVDIQSAP
ncbi:MAG: serine/threonine-protein kinase [bacterium]